MKIRFVELKNSYVIFSHCTAHFGAHENFIFKSAKINKNTITYPNFHRNVSGIEFSTLHC